MIKDAFSQFTNIDIQGLSLSSEDTPLFVYDGDGQDCLSVLGVLKSGGSIEQISLLNGTEQVAASFKDGLYEDGIHYSSEGVRFFASGGDIPVNRVTGENLILEEQRSVFHTALLERDGPDVTGCIY